MIIAIDGPAGSGKTTTARRIAEKLGILYLDTGATYRALTLAALEKDLDLNDAGSLEELAKNIDLRLETNRVFLQSKDVSQAIRTPRIDKNISMVVKHPGVREVMVNLQRDIAKGNNCIAEGRDVATVVFPKAEFKFYLDADEKKRAQRRYKELQEKEINIEFAEVKSDLTKRDSADKNRVVGPLKVSEDAIIIDTTDLSIEDTADEIIKYINSNKLH
tara:strand:- start:1235 stop:1888 length:654 start_codon:yes stop_codon:yes gene_type:complete